MSAPKPTFLKVKASRIPSRNLHDRRDLEDDSPEAAPASAHEQAAASTRPEHELGASADDRDTG